MARIWTLRCSGIQLTRYGHSCVMQQCVVVLVRAPLYALRNAALPHAVGCPAGTPLGMIDPRWSDRQILRSSDREIEIPSGHDPRHPRWSNTSHWRGQSALHMYLSTCKRMGPTAWTQGKWTLFVLLRGRVTTRSKTQSITWVRSRPPLCDHRHVMP